MNDRNVSISQRENYTPSGFTQFLWWLATAEKELLTDCVVDRNRYRIIGMTVLATWSFATLAWTYFFSTFTSSPLSYVPMGLFMGFVVLCIDRALIKGINKFNKNKFGPLLLRGVLALTIGLFMAQPAILFMFDKEINMQASLDNEKRKLVKRGELDSLYHDRKFELLSQQSSIQKSLQDQSILVNKARENYLSEADGSGGTGRVGIKEIALAKKKEFDQLDLAFQEFRARQQPRLDDIDAELKTIENRKKKEEENFIQYLRPGFLMRVEALNNLIENNDALKYRYYLIVIILMLIELMPVITKHMVPAGTYDEKVFWREEMEKEMTQANMKQEKALKTLYNDMAQENNIDIIRQFFSVSKGERTEKLNSFSKKWKEDEHQTFDGIWERLKREVMSKQEN